VNRIILIGNGFDLAHGLKTSYADFIDWYWKEWGRRLLSSQNKVENDGLCSFKLSDSVKLHSWAYVWGWHHKRPNPREQWNENEIIKLAMANRELCDYVITSLLLKELCQQLEERNWVDIENVYYKHLSEESEHPEKVNAEMDLIRNKLIDYLIEIQKSVEEVGIQDTLRKKMLAPFDKRDFAIGALDKWHEMLQQRVGYGKETWNEWMSSFFNRDRSWIQTNDVNSFISNHADEIKDNGIKGFDDGKIPIGFLLPDRMLMLNFNYTSVADSYFPMDERFSINHIHGELSKPESVIFCYGDEIDENYKIISNKNDNEYLKNIKSIKYLESSNYRNLLDFIESDTYQIFIMGHSCGNSDRTLLNTLFEHRNCVSIKPFYFIRKDGTDNYMELVQNISRNFTDMKLMRDRVVNKTFCEPYSDLSNTMAHK